MSSSTYMIKAYDKKGDLYKYIAKTYDKYKSIKKRTKWNNH